MNTITIELCAEDRAALDKLYAALNKLQDTVDRLTAPVNTMAKTVEPTEEPLPKQPTAPKVIEPQPEAAPEPQPEEVKVERSDIQKKVVELSQAGKKDAVRSIVTAYNNTKVSDIPEDKLGEVFEKLTALEG